MWIPISWHQALFYALLITSCGYALWRGGAPERMVAATLLCATALTYFIDIAPSGTRAGHFGGVENAVAIIDTAALLVVLGVALFADRFWPLWLTAIQAFSAIGHLSRWIGGPEILPHVYKMAHAFSAYPGLILLLLGTIWHQQRLRRDGIDPAWSTYLLPSTLAGRRSRLTVS